MRIAITGATGLIGTALASHLASVGHEVVGVVRRNPTATDITWSPSERMIDEHALDGIGAVVHLAGAGIADHRWTAEYKQQIRDSRVAGTELIAQAIASADDGPAVLLSGSAIGIYGARGGEELDERSAPGDGFLADVTVEWERATRAAEDAGARVAHLRTGIVLSADGGALKKQLPLFKLGLGGRMGPAGSFPVRISSPATSCSLTLCCCEYRRKTENAFSGLSLNRSIRMPCACPIRCRESIARHRSRSDLSLASATEACAATTLATSTSSEVKSSWDS